MLSAAEKEKAGNVWGEGWNRSVSRGLTGRPAWCPRDAGRAVEAEPLPMSGVGWEADHGGLHGPG